MLRLSGSTSLLSLALLSTLVAGCGGGGGGGSSSGTATPPSAAPDFGGNVTTIQSASTTVLATTTLNAFTAFRNSGSVSDLVISPIAGLRDRAFVVEDKGSVRVLALNAGAPTFDRLIDLEAGGLPSGTALGDLQVCDAQTAVVTASGNETLYVFNPSAAAPVFRLDIDAVAVTWPAGTLNSVGADVGGSPLPLTFTASAVVVGSRLIFCSSNLDSSFNYNPGTVVALNWNANTRTATTAGASVIQTTRFNPAGLTLVQTAQGPVLLVTNGGPFGTGPASIDVIDPVGFRLVGQIGLGARNPGGSIAVSPDGRRGYVGSLGSSEVYVLDLEAIGTALSSSTIADLSTRFRGGIRLPTGPSSAFISSVELSSTGNYLYAVDYNQSLVWVVDLTNPVSIAAKVVGFRRSDTSGFSNSANKLAVRPGPPGQEFTGPSLFIMTGFLAAADQTATGVAMALDAVSVNRH